MKHDDQSAMPRLFLQMLFLAALILTGVGADASQTVEITYRPSEEMSSIQARSKARELIFVQACLQEARALLSEPLEPRREQVLKEFLAPEAEQLVQGYTDISFHQSGEDYVLRSRVVVNTAELKRFLKDLGIFYTAGKTLPYTLLTGGLAVQDLEHVLKLQTMTGLDPRADSDRKLMIEKLGDTYWRANLEDGGRTWLAEGLSLESVWKKIWSRFFSGDSVQTAVSRQIRLVVGGWTTTEGLHAFDRMLSTWTSLLDESLLLEVRISPANIEAVWRMNAINRDGFEERVQRFTRDRGLSFSLQDDPLEGGGNATAGGPESSPGLQDGGGSTPSGL